MAPLKRSGVSKPRWPIVITDQDIFAWQMRRSIGAPLTGVTITLQIRLPHFPIERVCVHLREEIFLAKLRVDVFWREGCELGKAAMEGLNELA